MLKTRKLLLLTGVALTGAWVPAHAQREAPARGERREQRQQASQNLTPEQKQQNTANRMQERLKSATPEQRQRIEAMTQQGGGQNALAAAQTGGRQNGAGGQAGGRNNAGGGGRGGRGGRNQAAVPLTPEQRDAQRRQMMANAGITDTFTQDDIIAFLNAEDQAREPLIRLARAAAATLNPRTLRVAVLSDAVPQNEQNVENAFNNYQKALAADKIRHEAALKSLDASIGYSSNPRLKSFLTLVGVIDNDALALGGATAIFGPAPAVPVVPAADNAPRQVRTPQAAPAVQKEAVQAEVVPAETAKTEANAALATPAVVAPVETNPFLQ